MSAVKIGSNIINLSTYNFVKLDGLKVKIIFNNSTEILTWEHKTEKDASDFHNQIFRLLINPKDYNYNILYVK